MNKSLLTLVLIFGIFSRLNAQGVFGKKTSVSYEAGISFLGRNGIWDSDLLTRHSIACNYAFFRRLEGAISINFSRKTLNLGTANFISLGGLSNQTQVFEDVQLIEINDLSVSIKLNYFPKSKGGFAPIGAFYGLAYERGFQNSFRIMQSADSTQVSLYDNIVRKPLNVISLTLGRNIVLSSRYILGFGITSGYNVNREDQFRRFIARPFINFGIAF